MRPRVPPAGLECPRAASCPAFRDACSEIPKATWPPSRFRAALRGCQSVHARCSRGTAPLSCITKQRRPFQRGRKRKGGGGLFHNCSFHYQINNWSITFANIYHTCGEQQREGTAFQGSLAPHPQILSSLSTPCYNAPSHMERRPYHS